VDRQKCCQICASFRRIADGHGNCMKYPTPASRRSSSLSFIVNYLQKLTNGELSRLSMGDLPCAWDKSDSPAFSWKERRTVQAEMEFQQCRSHCCTSSWKCGSRKSEGRDLGDRPLTKRPAPSTCTSAADHREWGSLGSVWASVVQRGWRVRTGDTSGTNLHCGWGSSH
jgi:hypothetical protein